MRRANEESLTGPGVVNTLMQGDAHAVRDMGACGDQYGKMEETPGGSANDPVGKRGELKTMVLRAAAHKSHLLPKGSTSARHSCTARNEKCI